MTQLLNVSVFDGKYTVIQEADGRLHALRYGEPWKRDLVGDKLVLCLAQELAEAREDLTDAKELIDSLEQALASAQKCIDPTGHAPGAYTDPGPLTAADCSVARWPTLRDAKGKTFAERKAERAALLDQAKPATLEQAAEDAARMHSQMEADGTLRRAPLLDADFASLEARILASYHAAYPNLQALAKSLKEAGKLSDEQFQQALQRAAEHLRGQAPEAGMRLLKPAELVAITPNRTETTADFARRANIPPGTPLFDAARAIAAFKATVNDAADALAAKLNTKA